MMLHAQNQTELSGKPLPRKTKSANSATSLPLNRTYLFKNKIFKPHINTALKASKLFGSKASQQHLNYEDFATQLN
jgi:hypothetical protein